jgi:hypothetical protein
MSYDPSVPNPNISPGLFPAQNNTNYTRIKQIINGDHLFNDSAQPTDGVHRQTTYISRSQPNSLPSGTNSMTYSWVDGLGRSQLRFYNGSTDVQITPPQELYPIRIVVSQSLGNGATGTVYSDPGFRWAGTGWGVVDNTTTFTFQNILRSGGNDLHEIDDSGGSQRPSFLWSGNNLLVKNNFGSTQTIVASLIINRIS